MSPQTTKLLQDRLAILPQEIINLVQSNQINETVLKIQDDFSLSEVQASLLSNEILLTVLFFCELSTLPKRIEDELDIAEDVSEKMSSVIKELVFEKYQDIYLAADNAISADESLPPSTTAPSVPIPTPSAVTSTPEQKELDAEIAEAEAALQAVPEIRTMAKDIEKTKQAQPENVYTSSQEALLKESARKLPDDESRWGNQT